jgi:ADP-heptose:LPS heptosyltransferase
MNSAEIINLSQEKIKKILIINLGGIGDILLSTPALKALRSSYPDSRLYLLVAGSVVEFAKRLPYIDEVFIFNLKEGVMELVRNVMVLSILRKHKIDLAVNMRTLVSQRSAFKMRILLAAINPKARAGRDTEGRGRFFDFKIAEADRPEQHELEHNREMMRALGIEIKDNTLDFKIEEDSVKKINLILEKEEIAEEDILVCIHFGGKPSHRWPLENLLEVAKEISKKVKCKFVLAGGKDELGAELCAAYRYIVPADITLINLTGKLTLNELGALIKRSGLFIVNDTGPMHIAAALHAPLLALFGPGYLNQFDPRVVSDKAVVLYKKSECAPCNKVVCNSMKCLAAITPEEVTKAALEILSKRMPYPEK